MHLPEELLEITMGAENAVAIGKRNGDEERSGRERAEQHGDFDNERTARQRTPAIAHLVDGRFATPLPPRTRLVLLAEDAMLPHPLSAVADLLAAAPDLAPGALLVRLEGDPPCRPDDELALGMLPIDGHPSETLLGFVAPSDWWALGLISPGWANPAGDELDDVDLARGRRRGPRYAERTGRRRATVVSLQARDGTEATRILVGDDEPLDPGPGGGGLLPDCLRRALGLPTEPPAVATAELFAALWLTSIAGTMEVERRRVGWAEAAALHPVALLLADGPRVSHDDLVDAAGALDRVVGWRELRAVAAEGRWAVGDLPADVARVDGRRHVRPLGHGRHGASDRSPQPCRTSDKHGHVLPHTRRPDDPPLNGRKNGVVEAGEALAVLGVAEGASWADVRAAYRRLIRTTHPDVAGASRGADVARVTEAFAVLEAGRAAPPLPP